MPHSPLWTFGWLAAPIVAFGVASCSRAPEPSATNAGEQAKPAPVETSEPSTIAEPVLDRERLLITFMKAASAAVVGADDQEMQQSLKGRSFEIRMRFGCPGGAPSATRNWSYDEKSGALKVSVKPDIHGQSDGAAAGKEPAPPPRAGFLIPAPTILASGCPAADFAAAVAASHQMRFGLVETARPEQPRSEQLLDTYDIVKKIAADAVPTNGLDLIIRGRLESDAGRTINCAPRDGAVECLANSTIDKVSIENPATSVLVAEWGAS
jgi:hypothetical protein